MITDNRHKIEIVEKNKKEKKMKEISLNEEDNKGAKIHSDLNTLDINLPRIAMINIDLYSDDQYPRGISI